MMCDFDATQAVSSVELFVQAVNHARLSSWADIKPQRTGEDALRQQPAVVVEQDSGAPEDICAQV